MVDLVLDDLCCPAGEGLEPSLELLVLPLYFNSLETLPSKLVTSSVSGEWYTISPLLKVYRAIIKDNLKLENKHLTQRAIVTAPTAFPMVALHRRLASTVGTTNRLSSRCIWPAELVLRVPTQTTITIKIMIPRIMKANIIISILCPS